MAYNEFGKNVKNLRDLMGVTKNLFNQVKEDCEFQGFGDDENRCMHTASKKELVSSGKVFRMYCTLHGCPIINPKNTVKRDGPTPKN